MRMFDSVKLVCNGSRAVRCRGWRGKHTTVPHDLSRKDDGIGGVGTWKDVRESTLEIVEGRDEALQVQAVIVYGWRRRLAGDLREVVTEARMGGRVIVLNELALVQQRAIKVLRRR